MTTSEAVEFVLERFRWSKYKLSQEMGCAPISIDQWLRGTKMSAEYRAIFDEKFGIEIDDSL